MARFIALLRSILFTPIFYIGSLFFVVAALLASPFSREMLKRLARSWGQFHRICCHILLGQKIRIIGDMPDGPYLYCFKHESAFETIEQLVLFHRPAVIAKKELFDIPLWGKVAEMQGMIPVEREAGAKAMRALMTSARVPHCTSAPLQAGFAGLYKILNVPVIPVAIDSGRLSPRRNFIKKAGIITYKVGETIPPGLPREEAEARVLAAINALNDE